MAIDPRKLRQSDLCRLLNSSSLGEVINERQLHRHRARAGLRIGDARFVDLLRYVAWLIEVRHSPKPEPQGDPYEILNPADVAAVEIAYLRGQRTPTIESGETDFDTLGMKWRGYFDFGVATQDHRAAVKSKGAA